MSKRIPRGVWNLPVVTPAGLGVAFAVNSRGELIATVEYEVDRWEGVWHELSALLDRTDPPGLPEPAPVEHSPHSPVSRPIVARGRKEAIKKLLENL
jgi:hypothetical protein